MRLPIQLHVLTANEVTPLRSVLDLFGRAFAEPQNYHGRQPDDADLADLLARDTLLVVAARMGEKAVGAAAAHVPPKFEQARSELYLYDLAVDESFRRRGIATALIERQRTLARQRGIHVIFVQADRDDAPAVALSDRLDPCEEVLLFDIDTAPAT